MNTVRGRLHGNLMGTLVMGLCWLAAPNSEATLPKPIPAGGIAVAVDPETKALVLKREGKKPVVLDWDERTKFFRDGQPVSIDLLKRDTKVWVLYNRLSFKNPRLREVRWWTGEKPAGA